MTHKTVPGSPERIYLQHDPEDTGEPFNEAHEVTWCADKINDTDIEYVRADLAAPQPQDSATEGETPRVDGWIYAQIPDQVTGEGMVDVVHADDARQLERELAAQQAEIERLEHDISSYIRITRHQANEIERLEAALAARSQP
jgi:hypothetical protein